MNDICLHICPVAFLAGVLPSIHLICKTHHKTISYQNSIKGRQMYTWSVTRSYQKSIFANYIGQNQPEWKTFVNLFGHAGRD